MFETIDPSEELRQRVISDKVDYFTSTFGLNNEIISVIYESRVR